jgi:hypothetical protein
MAHNYLTERGLILSEEEYNKSVGKVIGSDSLTVGFLLLAYNGSKLTYFIESHRDLFSQEIVDNIKEGKYLDLLFRGAHKLRNEKDFEDFVQDPRICLLWRKFVKANKSEIFNSTETNAIRGKKNLKQTEDLLNGLSKHTGIVFQLNFDS